MGANVNKHRLDGVNVALALAENKPEIKWFLQSKGAKHCTPAEAPGRDPIDSLSFGLTTALLTSLVAAGALPILLPVSVPVGAGAAIWVACVLGSTTTVTVGSEVINAHQNAQNDAFWARYYAEHAEQF
jgi:hypothetical protein